VSQPAAATARCAEQENQPGLPSAEIWVGIIFRHCTAACTKGAVPVCSYSIEIIVTFSRLKNLHRNYLPLTCPLFVELLGAETIIHQLSKIPGQQRLP